MIANWFCQVLIKYHASHPRFKPCQELTTNYIKLFSKLVFINVLRAQNTLVDALASLTSSLFVLLDKQVRTIYVCRRTIPVVEDVRFLKIKERFERNEYIEKKEDVSLLELEDLDDSEKPYYHEIVNYC